MKLRSLWRRFGAAAAAVAISFPASARDPFELDIVVGGQAGHFGYSSIEDLIEGVDPDSLKERFSARDPSRDQVDIELDFRGMAGVSIFFAPNTGRLQFAVPALDFTHDFGRGCNFADEFDCRNAREQALDELRDFLKKNPDFLKRFLTALTRFSPVDPLAGNPDSLFGKRMRADFDQGFTHKVSQIWGCGSSAFNFTNDQPIQVAAVGGVSDIFADAQARAAELQAQNEIGVGVLASSTTAKSQGGDFKSTSFVIPLSYTAKFDSDPRKKVRVDVPLTYTDTDGAVGYSAGIGLAYSHPLSDMWSLTPAIGIGATGSEDLGAAGGVSALSLTSAYTWRLGSFALSMGNSVGRYEALGITIGDIEAEADISNTVFTNGFLLTGPNSLIAKNLVVEYSFVDTRITGDDVYSDGSDEIGIAIGRINTTMGVIDSYTKFGISYLIADGSAPDGTGGDISSLRLNLSARF